MQIRRHLTTQQLILSTILVLASIPVTAADTNTPTPSSPPPPSSVFPSLTNPTLFAAAILNSTNTFRAQHNASSLLWNTTLATFASTVAHTCIFAHSGGPYGENLVAGYTDTTAAVDAWGNERADYDFDTPDFGEQTGHFTQLVWRDTTTVGCAAVQCDGEYSGEGSPAPGWFVVCEYWPRGNVLGEFAGEVSRRVDGGAMAEGSGDGASGGVRMMNGGEIGGVVVVGVIMVGLFLVND